MEPKELTFEQQQEISQILLDKATAEQEQNNYGHNHTFEVEIDDKEGYWAKGVYWVIIPYPGSEEPIKELEMLSETIIPCND